MVFKQSKKKMYYRQWYEKLRGCDLRIFELPDQGNTYYHFSVVCTDKNIKYSSLNDRLIYNTFDEVCAEAEKWVRDHIETEK